MEHPPEPTDATDGGRLAALTPPMVDDWCSEGEEENRRQSYFTSEDTEGILPQEVLRVPLRA